MKQPSITIITALLLILSSCIKQSDDPNIILLMADDLGWGDTGFNGNQQIMSPNMDKLADKGLIFTRFYSASPVCSPTRASCLTGRNPYRMGIPNANSGHLLKDELTIAEYLKDAGYKTGHFGKWHLGTFTSTVKDANRGKPGDSSHMSIPTDHGFDEFFSTESKVPTWDPMLKPKSLDTVNGESLRYGWTAPVNDTSSLFYNTRYWTAAEQEVTENLEGDDSRVIMDRAVEFIERSVAESQPFFSIIWFHTPHLPVVVPEDYKSRFSNKSNVQQLYYGSIAALDEQIGRLWKVLENNGISNNTLLFFCSDNGPEVRTPGSAGPFRGKKRDLYEGGIRVPAFVVYPDKISSGSQTGFPAFTTDYLPTILDILDLPLSDNQRTLDGISLAPAIFDESSIREKAMGFLVPGKMSWVTNQYKLISNDKGSTFELYDILNDPAEKTDIIESSPDISMKMKTEFDLWHESVEEDIKNIKQ